MAHYALVNEENIVVDVVVVGDEHDENGDEYLNSIGLVGRWIKTSYNTHGGEHKLGGTPLRMNFASVGFTYDESKDAFIAPKPNDNHIFDADTCTWVYNGPDIEEGMIVVDFS
jgi:hypothetical protein